MATIEITKNGPYKVSADVKLYREVIVAGEDGVLMAKRVGEIETKDQVENGFYYLCRCGGSKKAPFCSGAHEKNGFEGEETAEREKYEERAEVVDEGPEIALLDDQRCAFARFCHRQRGEVWTLTDESADAENKREALEGAMLCPAGRLTHFDKKTGKMYEKEYEPQIAVVEDPEKGVSAGLYVRGGVQLIGEDGFKYEKRNRYALCRCGHSSNKPFCDASHVGAGYRDEMR